MNRLKSASTLIKKVSVIAIVAGLGLSACATERQARGYMVNHDILNGITPGLDNINSVRNTMGRPSLTGTFDENTWYYISTQTVTRSIFNEEPVTHLIVAVHFNDNGIVEDVERYGMGDMKHVEPVADKTPTRGKTLGFFEQIFGNIGRFASAPGQTGRPY